MKYVENVREKEETTNKLKKITSIHNVFISKLDSLRLLNKKTQGIVEELNIIKEEFRTVWSEVGETMVKEQDNSTNSITNKNIKEFVPYGCITKPRNNQIRQNQTPRRVSMSKAKKKIFITQY